jgi:hypothetical protein
MSKVRVAAFVLFASAVLCADGATAHTVFLVRGGEGIAPAVHGGTSVNLIRGGAIYEHNRARACACHESTDYYLRTYRLAASHRVHR